MNSRDLCEAGVELEAVHSAALKNLAGLLDRLEAPAIEQVGDLYRLSAPENLAAAVMLDQSLMADGRERLGGTLVAAVPHRDELWIAAPTEAALAQLQQVVANAHYKDNHNLSTQLFMLGQAGWSVIAKS